jgi:glutathione peroxidase
MQNNASGAYAFAARAIDGEQVDLSRFSGTVSLIVNVASECGYTPQYAGLEQLQRDLGPRGFNVLAFPCNQFGSQEPGSENEIAAFCASRFKVTFALFAKIAVNGADAHPLYQFLKQERPGLLGTQAIKWNFTKFLVDRNGRVVKRYATATKPETLVTDIEALLSSET